MAREIYLRVVMTVEGVEYIAGLEMLPGDVMGDLRTKMRVRMKNASVGITAGRYQAVAEAIERSILQHWPDRAYFIEVGYDGEGWVQIWDPKGFIRKNG